MESLDNCPICGKKLQLQQINFKTAILMCIDTKCPYPCQGECVVVERSLQNINKPVDLCALLQKQERLEDSHTKQFMLDLEDLLKSHTQSHSVNNIEDTVKKEELPPSQGSVHNIFTEDQIQRGQFIELPELDEFLKGLLR